MTKTHGTSVHPEGAGTAKATGRTELFDLLREDHEKARELFKGIEKSSSTQVELRKELFTRLEQELLSHMEAEERFFYTALEPHDRARHLVLVGFEDHQVARIVIGNFNSLAVDDERWPAKLKVLSELTRRHVDEEEHELFDVAKKVLRDDQFLGITARIQEHKRESKQA
jgi:hemerythrin-like domain-containing protein